jgi:hypothetical protein
LRSYSGAALLHERCRPAWLRVRQGEARAALSALGIRLNRPESAAGWRHVFYWRASMNEDYGLSRHEAEVIACEFCVDYLLELNPVVSPDRLCAHCGTGEQPNDELRPEGPDGERSAWLHERCYSAWLEARRTEATTFLSAMGIRPNWYESAAGWHRFFEEQAAHTECNCYGVSRHEAEVIAYETCIETWILLNWVRSGGCAHCGAGQQPNDNWGPYFGAYCLHERCRSAWLQGRRIEARAALSAMGLGATAGTYTIGEVASCGGAPCAGGGALQGRVSA